VIVGTMADAVIGYVADTEILKLFPNHLTSLVEFFQLFSE
jgi:hypothetical protein